MYILQVESTTIICKKKMITELKDDKIKTETAATCYCLLIYNLLFIGPTERTRER